uniref:C3H1-type domain-containing protein n=1 Tax=Alexandrium monilatum TaxID=311494 RepID=A0A7S4RD68_9DINO
MQSVSSASMPRRSLKARSEKSESRVVFRQQFFKTELCRFYQSGCARGKDCCYAHGEGELRIAPDLNKTSLCKDWVNRRCPLKAEACPFAHGWGDMRATPAFVEYGARQSRKAPARGPSQSEAAGAEGRAAAPTRVPRRSGCGLAGPAKPSLEAESRASSPSRSSSSRSSSSSGASSAGKDKPPAETPSSQGGSSAGEAGRAEGEPLRVAIMLQPCWGPAEVPVLSLQQLAPAGLLPPCLLQGLPDNRALEALLKQAMPDHYED